MFDTPIRLLRSTLSNIVFDETDPNFSFLLKKYEVRLKKYKSELRKDVDFILDDLKNKILSKGYGISSLINEINQEEFGERENEFNNLIESESNDTLMRIETVIAEKNRELSQEFENINLDADVTFYLDTLNIKENERHKIETAYDSSSLNKKLSLIKQTQRMAGKMTEYTGVSKATGFLAKAKDASGSQAHNMVKSLGSSIGYKFKPWEAVKIAQKAGNIAKFAGPALSFIAVGYEINEALKEEKEIKKIAASKNQMNSNFLEISSELVLQIRNKFNEFISENIDMQIDDFEKQKFEIIKANEQNSKFSNHLNILDAEYVDFIELINSNEP